MVMQSDSLAGGHSHGVSMATNNQANMGNMFSEAGVLDPTIL